MREWAPSLIAIVTAIAAIWIARDASITVDRLAAAEVDWPPHDFADSEPSEAASERLELRNLLAAEFEQRLVLEKRIAILERQLGLDGSTASREGASSPANSADVDSSDEDVSVAEGESLPVGVFDARRIEGSDIPLSRVEDLLDEWEEYTLEKAELNDRANREGWARTAEHYVAHQELDSRFQEEVGDAGFDAILYATGRPNRVEVTHVLGGSAADRSGIRSGDVVLSYGGRRIFDQEDLRQATMQGSRDEEVEIRVVREGEERRLFVRRGPLGSMLRAIQSEPQP